jgi:hypothetical protein
MKKILILFFCGLAAAFSAAGCSTDENPVSPDKMNELRKQEGDERANFNPPGGAPPSGN